MIPGWRTTILQATWHSQKKNIKKRKKKICHANNNQKRARVAILTSDKIDFKPRIVTRDKGYYILIKVLAHQEDLMIINIYGPNRAQNI